MKETSKRLFVNCGIDSYTKAQRYYYTDKTLLIRDLLSEDGKVKVFMLPRRCGKTLGLDTVKTFFEVTGNDTSVYFRDKKIWQCGDGIKAMQGRHPVILISFCGIDRPTWRGEHDAIVKRISTEFKIHRVLAASNKADPDDVEIFKRIKSGTADEKEYRASLRLLCRLLYMHYGKKAIVLLDEYDTPVLAGYEYRYRTRMKRFMGSWLASGLRDNPYLEFAVLIGSKLMPGDFCGFKDYVPYTLKDRPFSEDFSFSREEVRTLLEYYGYEDQLDSLCELYGAQMTGDADIVIPWYVMRYLAIDCGEF